MYYISISFAWISIALLAFTALKYVARKSKKKSLNQFFRKYHTLAGKLMIATTFLHGLFAGNKVGTAFEDGQIASSLFSFNLGNLSFILTLLLWFSYAFRQKLKNRWFRLHRILTILLILSTLLHIQNEIQSVGGGNRHKNRMGISKLQEIPFYSNSL